MANMNQILARQKTYINDLKKYINDKNNVDIVLNLTALNSRSKTRLRTGNRIIVMSDSNHNNASSVYEFNATTSSWNYVESFTTNYYNISQIDALFATERDRLTALETEVGPQTNFGASTLRGRVKAIEDANYQGQIDAINAGQNLADIVASKAALNSYTTTNLHSGDKIQVLADESIDATNPPSTVYNWNGTVFNYIGKYGQDAYTKSEVYNKLEVAGLLLDKVDKVEGKALSTNDFTNEYKSQIDSNTTNRHTHSNKSILDQVTRDVVDNEHSHDNKSLLDTYTQTETDLSDAVDKKHSHSNKTVLDQVTQNVVDHEHTHSNKSVLDNVTAAYTIEEQTKLSAIEAGAQVNVPADSSLDVTSNNSVSNAAVTAAVNSIMNVIGGKSNFVLSYSMANTDNAMFNSDADTLTVTPSDTIKDINGNIIVLDTLRLGDIFLVTEIDKPDRWVGNIAKDANDVITSITLYKMEATKVDLSPYLTAVSYDSTNKKIIYTKDNTAYDVVSIATIKTALELGVAAGKAVTNNTSATAFDNTDENLVTNKTLYYGTPSINNSKTYTSSTSIYAPTSGGTAGQFLKSAGSTSAPVWESLKTINNESLLGNENIDLQPKIDNTHKLDSDLINDANQSNKFVTATEKENISKALYNLGAFDSADGKTRQTWYDVITRNNTEYRSDIGIYLYCFNELSIEELVGSIDLPYRVSYDNTNSHWYREGGNTYILVIPNDIDKNVQIQYKLATSYTDNIIENESILPLDANMANKIRQKVVDGLNLFSGLKTYKYSTSDGSRVIDSSYLGTDYIPVKPNTTYTLSDFPTYTNHCVYYYTNTTTYIERTSGDNISTRTFTTPSNCYYIAIGYTNSLTSAQVSEGINAKVMLNEGNHTYPHSDFNPKEHITNNEATLLKQEEEKCRNAFTAYKWTNISATATGSTWTINSANSITLTYATARTMIYGNYQLKPYTTYTFSFVSSSQSSTSITISCDGTQYNSNMGETSLVFTTGSTGVASIRFYCNSATTITITNIMINIGTHAYPYQAYNGEIVHMKDIEPMLLWKNSSPTSAFVSGSITTKDMSKFKYIVIEYSRDKNGTYTYTYSKNKYILNKGISLSYSLSYQGTIYISTREMLITSSTSISFGDGAINGGVNNDQLIPVAIYGTNVL